MSFEQFIAILKARWKLAAAVPAAVLCVVMAVSFIMQPQYTANASVVVDFKPDPVSSVLLGGTMPPGYMATQVDIIQSDRVAQRVVRNMKLADNPRVQQQWREATQGREPLEAWLGETFKNNLTVKPSRDSNVITLSYSGADPRFSSALANAFVQAYIDTVLELRVNPAKQFASFFDVRAQDARDALEKAQSKLSAFQQEKGIIATDERFDIENARLSELSSQLVMIQNLAAESSSRQAQVDASGDRMNEVLNNGLISGLKADVARAEARLQELNSRLGDNNPQVVEAKANIAELRKRLEAETRRVTSGVGVTNAINRQHESQVRADLEAQRTKVLHLKQVRDEGAVLARDVENAQRAYDAIQSRLTQTSLESQATLSNVSMLTPANVPLSPSSPRKLLNAVVALVVGTILGIGAVLMREIRDRRIRSKADVLTALHLPMLGVMLPPPRRRWIGKAQAPAMQNRILSGQPALERSS